jgi:hypothetical protein
MIFLRIDILESNDEIYIIFTGYALAIYGDKMGKKMGRVREFLAAAVPLVTLLVMIGVAGQHYGLKPARGESNCPNKYNSLIGAVSVIGNNIGAQAAGILRFATVEDQIVWMTATPIYVDGDTSTVPKDLSDKPAVHKVLLPGLGTEGGKFHTVTVASRSFTRDATTEDFNAPNLTATLTRDPGFALPPGLRSLDGGPIYSRDYGTPSQATLQAIKDAIGPNPREVSLDPGTWSITGNFNAPANLVLKPMAGAVLNVKIPAVAITGLSRAKGCVVTWPQHNLATGDMVFFQGITQAGGWRALNGAHQITKITDDTFRIQVDTSSYQGDYRPATDPGTYNQTLHIQSFRAGPNQCFNADPGRVVFGPGAADRYFSEWFGAVGGGSGANDSDPWVSLANAVPPDAEVRVEKNYYFRSPSTITFAHRVILTGKGSFTVGSAVGNRAAILLAGDYSRASGFTIIGDHANFTNANISTNDFRRSIRVTGNNVDIEGVNFIGGVVPLSFSLTTGGSVKKCKFKNTDINADATKRYPNQNYCQAIYTTGDTFGLAVEGNYCYGYGEFITAGNRSASYRLANNILELQGDNGIYCSGINFTIIGNSIRNMVQAGIKGYYSHTVISENNIYTTGSYSSSMGIYCHAQNVVSGQPRDVNNNTSHGNVISSNSISGTFTNAAIAVAEHPVDYSGFSDVSIVGNYIKAGATNAAATRGVVGILLYSAHGNPVSWENVVANNHVEQCYRGLTVITVGSGYYAKMKINDNVFKGLIGNAMNLTQVKESLISNNIYLDPIGTNVTSYGAYLTNCTYNTFANNHFGNLHGGHAAYGFYEVSGCSYNNYENNRISGLPSSANHYHLNDASGRITLPNLSGPRY